MMAEVLNFPTERIRPSANGQSGADAEVLIFPGIRIERGDFSLSDRLNKPRRGQKAATSPKGVNKRRK